MHEVIRSQAVTILIVGATLITNTMFRTKTILLRRSIVTPVIDCYLAAPLVRCLHARKSYRSRKKQCD